MGKYLIKITKGAKEDFQKLRKSGRVKDMKKIQNLLLEIEQNPREGTGQIEQLKYIKGREIWSRRISERDRLIYEIIDSEILVIIIQALGHYDDK